MRLYLRSPVLYFAWRSIVPMVGLLGVVTVFRWLVVRYRRRGMVGDEKKKRGGVA